MSPEGLADVGGEAWDVARPGRARGLPVGASALDRGYIDRLLEGAAAGYSWPAAPGRRGELRKLVSYPLLGTRSVPLAQPAADDGMGVSLAGHFERSILTAPAVGQFETADCADGSDGATAGHACGVHQAVDLSVDLLEQRRTMPIPEDDEEFRR